MSTKSKNTAKKADSDKNVKSDFTEHMRREYFNNHVFRGSTVLLLNNGQTLHISVPARREW